ncbi:MAG: N-acetylmuramoyl-L-alanine amidase [Candidatus Magnetobacterium sp. LHC-1]
MKALIINQSQQAGIEWQITSQIADCLYCTLNREGKIKVSLVPCYRRTDTIDSDSTLLIQSVNVANDFYKKYRAAGLSHMDICQIDIHADSLNGKTFGTSALYISENGNRLAEIVCRELSNLTPWGDRGIVKRTDLWTLKKSSAVNIVSEISFYDESRQRQWMKDNVPLITNSLKNAIYKYHNVV